jgi:type III pantothenate kinase
MSIDALFNRTALLPKIKLKKPNRIIGNDTVESIRSGIFYGLALMIDGIIEKIRSNSKKRIFTIATGGLASFFAPRCKNIDKIDGDLTLKGLCLIYNKINKL